MNRLRSWIAAARRPYWVRADCGCAWTIHPVRVLVCDGHLPHLNLITSRVTELLAGGSR